MKCYIIKVLFFLFAIQSYTYANSVSDLLAMYQPEETITNLKKELSFWQDRVQKSPKQQSFQLQLAHANTALFTATAKIKYLKDAEYLLQNILDQGTISRASVLRSLAHNYISQHRFCEAMDAVLEAHEIGDNRRASELMLFDLHEELGDDQAQRNLLSKLSQQRNFDFLIRLAKWEDGQGNLDKTIALMKEAETIAEKSQQLSLKTWVYTNLGDYYGHAGELALSKSYYLKALSLNPADWYSMKALAWMAYANKNHTSDAMSILQHIAQYSADPGIALLQAEIMEYTGKQQAATQEYEQLATQLSHADYGDMYNSFLCEYYLQDKNRLQQAMTIAKREIQVRAIPHAYDLLAQVYYAQGKIDLAQKISRKHIWEQTFEPNILKNQLHFFYDSKEVYIKNIRQEIVEAKYEIGPLNYQSLPLNSHSISSLE